MSAPSDLLAETTPLHAQFGTRAKELAERDQEILPLRQDLEVLRRMIFGAQTEKRGAPASRPTSCVKRRCQFIWKYGVLRR